MEKGLYLLLIMLSCLAYNGDDKKRNPEVIGETVSESKVEKSEAETDSTFDPEKWKVRKGREYPYRDGMLADLMHNEEVRALKKDEIMELLGKPDRMDTNYLFYRINEKRLGWLTLHTKTMVVKMYPESTVNWIKIHQ